MTIYIEYNYTLPVNEPYAEYVGPFDDTEDAEEHCEIWGQGIGIIVDKPQFPINTTCMTPQDHIDLVMAKYENAPEGFIEEWTAADNPNVITDMELMAAEQKLIQEVMSDPKYTEALKFAGEVLAEVAKQDFPVTAETLSLIMGTVLNYIDTHLADYLLCIEEDIVFAALEEYESKVTLSDEV